MAQLDVVTRVRSGFGYPYAGIAAEELAARARVDGPRQPGGEPALRLVARPAGEAGPVPVGQVQAVTLSRAVSAGSGRCRSRA